MLSLEAHLEALLFVAGEPVELSRLAAAVDAKEAQVKAALGELGSSLGGRGLQLEQHDGRVRLVTHPDAAESVRTFLMAEARTELSRAALETLAIIAYRGPITKSGIETVRGISSDAMLRNLMQRGLVTEQGKADEPGRPTLYGVSHAFLEHFGLAGLHQLPPLEVDQKQAADAA